MATIVVAASDQKNYPGGAEDDIARGPDFTGDLATALATACVGLSPDRVVPRTYGLELRSSGRGRVGGGADFGIAFRSGARFAIGRVLGAGCCQPSLASVIEGVLQVTWKAPQAAALQGATQSVVNHVVLENLLALARSSSPGPSAIARSEALSLRSWLTGNHGADAAAAVARIDEFEDSEKFAVAPRPEAPPGQPIGNDE